MNKKIVEKWLKLVLNHTKHRIDDDIIWIYHNENDINALIVIIPNKNELWYDENLLSDYETVIGVSTEPLTDALIKWAYDKFSVEIDEEMVFQQDWPLFQEIEL